VRTPDTLLEAIRQFSDTDAARDYMVALRWPHGIACPRYGCGSAYVQWIATRKLWRCKGCKRQFTVKVGTIFEDSPIGFDKWLPALWILTNTKNGTSSYELARDLDVTQRTAWFMLHRIRHAMQAGTFEKLSGSVEADETYVGGKANSEDRNPDTGNLMPTGPQENKTIVMGIVERKGKIRAFVIEDTKRETLHAKIKQNVANDSTVYTDEWKAYRQLTNYSHFVINHGKEYVKGHIHTNNIENFWSLLKRTVKGTYICPRPWQLNRYVDAQAFRYNVRDLNDDGRFFLLAKGTDGKRLTYKTLTKTVSINQLRTKALQKAAALQRVARARQNVDSKEILYRQS
jgi:transposase-like protein